MLVEPGNQFSLTRAALSTCAAPKNQILISTVTTSCSGVAVSVSPEPSCTCTTSTGFTISFSFSLVQ